jgi:hypothetical protein
LAVGFSKFAAERVAFNTQGVDDRPETNPTGLMNLNHWPGSVKMRADYHFTTTMRRIEMLNAFERGGSYTALGEFLHAEQDSFSHKGFFAWDGHAYKLSAPDKTYNDPEKADVMAMRTFQVLQFAADRLGQHGHQVSWDLIADRIREFNRAKKAKEKKRILDELEGLLEQQKETNEQ